MHCLESKAGYSALPTETDTRTGVTLAMFGVEGVLFFPPYRNGQAHRSTACNVWGRRRLIRSSLQKRTDAQEYRLQCLGSKAFYSFLPTETDRRTGVPLVMFGVEGVLFFPPYRNGQTHRSTACNVWDRRRFILSSLQKRTDAQEYRL